MTPREMKFLREPKQMTICREAMCEVSKETGFLVDEIRGPSRERALVRARWMAMRLARNRGVSLPQIGKEFNRDHTSVMYALRRVEEELQ